MAITLRLVKGSELTHSELDENFTDLNTNKQAADATLTALSTNAGDTIAALSRDWGSLGVQTLDLAIAQAASTISPTFTGTAKFAGFKGTFASKSGAYTLLPADTGTLIVCTATLTITTGTVANLAPNAGDWFAIEIYNQSAAGTVTIDGPGATNPTLATKESCTIYCYNGGEMTFWKSAAGTVI